MTASLLPYNSTPVERAIEGAQSLIGDVPTPLRDLWNPDTCPLNLLPWLAWALSIDAWSPNWPESVKRDRVRRAIDIQRHKGTAKSVQDVVAAYGANVAIREWWETTPKGAPHTFTLTLFAGDASLVDAIIADVTATKPLRSQFTFTQAVATAGAIGVTGGFRPVLYVRFDGLSVAA